MTPSRTRCPVATGVCAIAAQGAAAAIAACLLGFSWLMSVFLGRHLSLGELAAATVLLVAALAYGLSVLRVRNRRKVQDMRDSALW